MQTQLIYVPLRDEGTDVWKPVSAQLLSPAVFRITDTKPDDEAWAFESGQAVMVEQREFTSGHSGLVAVAAAPNIRLELSLDELRIVQNALNEICNGLDLEGEFETRIGSDVGAARKLLDRVARS